MSKLIANIKREPVRWFTGLDLLVQVILSGVLLFTSWNPNTEQTLWILGVPTVLATIFGVTIVRNAVTPNEKLTNAEVDRAANR